MEEVDKKSKGLYILLIFLLGLCIASWSILRIVKKTRETLDLNKSNIKTLEKESEVMEKKIEELKKP